MDRWSFDVFPDRLLSGGSSALSQKCCVICWFLLDKSFRYQPPTSYLALIKIHKDTTFAPPYILEETTTYMGRRGYSGKVNMYRSSSIQRLTVYLI